MAGVFVAKGAGVVSAADAATVGVVIAVAAGVAVAVAAAVADGAAVAVGDVSGVRRRTGVDVAVALGEAVAVAVGVVVGTGVVSVVRRWNGVAATVTDGDAIGAEVAAGDVDVTGAADASPRASVGFTKVFDGAFGGGVASDFIFARAFSAACLSAMSSQPRSTSTCAMVSLTVRGRSTACPRAINGAGITTISPRTTDCGVATLTSTLTCRSRRNRSIGCCVRVRNSS